MGHDQSGLEVAITTPDYSLPQPEDRSASLPELYKSKTYSNAEYYDNGVRSPGVNSTFGLSDKVVAEPPKRQRICGISPLWYGIIVASVTAVIVGVAVGVGVGSYLSRERQQNNCTGNPSATPTQTAPATVTVPLSSASTTAGGYYVDYFAVRPTLIATVPDVCPVFGGQAYTAPRGTVFSRNCTGGWTSADLATIWAYSHQDCIDACEAMNERNATTKCTRLQWDRHMMINAPRMGNCFLKSDNAIEIPTSVDGQISARLVSYPPA